MDVNIIKALLVSAIAGLSLVVGGIFPLVFKYTKREILPFVLSFTGGIMLYVAFVKFLPAATYQLEGHYDPTFAFRLSSISFLIGLLITTPIDIILLYFQRKFRLQKMVPINRKEHQEYELFALIFLSITFHKFFEGIAAFLTYFSAKEIAIPIILSIIAHNIPEGSVIAMIMFKKTQSKSKALLYCLITALSEPVGAICSYLFIHETLSIAHLGLIKAFLAGLLVNTALDELIPSADIRGGHRFSMRGIVVGMLFMGILLMLH